MSQVKWTCLGCNFILGYVEDKRIIRIKRKDLLTETILGKGGQITEFCTRCGKPNTLSDEPDNEADPK